ncbi:MAG: cardiolipin synthase [Eubacterium sp.]|nr:cardiolipin synthase [Eubacterium sp.]
MARVKKERTDGKYLQGLKGRVQNSLSGFFRGCIVALLVLVQFALIIGLPFFLRQYASISYLIIEILGMLTILILTNDNRSMSYKYAWLCIVVALPIAGNIMFALWGRVGKRNKLHQKIKKKINLVDSHLQGDREVAREFARKHPVTTRISKYMDSEGSPLFKNNEALYFSSGEEAFESIFEDLEKAKHFIFMEFFIVAEGALWDKIHEILKRKLYEGVEIKFLYDDFGALLRTGKDFASRLEKEGFQVEVFNPIQKYASKLFLNFRDHRKILVIDGQVAYTGGFNLADEYANLVERFGYWKDAGIRVQGDLVWPMTINFLELWVVCSNEEVDYDYYYKFHKHQIESRVYGHVLRDGPALGTRSFVGNCYRQMIQYAGKILYIMTPYLLLEEPMVDSLIEAAKRGVDVRLITPGIPDKKTVKQMTEYNYGILLKNGIRIYEFTPGFIHSKVVLNEHSAIVGTINMDYRSFYLHYENGIWIYDTKFKNAVKRDFQKTFSASREVTYEEWKNRPLWLKIKQAVLHPFDTLT